MLPRHSLHQLQERRAILHLCRATAYDSYAAYLRQRWDEGERNSAALLREIRAQGYTGAASTLRKYVGAWRPRSRHTGRRRQSEDDTTAAPPHRRRFSPRQTRWILLRPTEDLDEQERAYRQALGQDSAIIATAQRLVADFGQIVRTRAHSALDAWLAAAARSRIPELVSFVRECAGIMPPSWRRSRSRIAKGRLRDT